MPIPLLGALAIAGATIGSAVIGANAAGKAADAQARAAGKASDVQRQNFLDTKELLLPQIQAGDTAREYQLGLTGLPGGVSREEAMRSFETSPGFQFRLGQGVNAIDQSAVSGGRLYSGKTLKDLTRFGQDIGAEEFGTHYNRLAGLSNSGQAATGTQVRAGQTTAGNLSSIALGAGDARATGYINRANSLIGGAQNLSDLYSYYNPPKF